MAEQGILYLKNESLTAMYEAVSNYGTSVEDILYEAYKNTFKLSKSNYFRGTAADAFKSYIAKGAINAITEMMDIAADLTMVIQLMTEAFHQYEIQTDGRVREYNLDSIKETLNEKEQIYDDSKTELDEALKLAAQYITVQPLSMDTVNDSYLSTHTTVDNIRTGLYDVDKDCLELATELLERITKLQTFITGLMQYCYNDDGSINVDKLNSIDSQGWFYEAGNVALVMKLQEDPFVYAAGETTLAEDQWAAGLCSDVYVYAGYKILSASGEAGRENGTAFARGKVALMSVNGYAQFTDYLKGEIEAKTLFAEGNAQIGWSDEYKGGRLEGEVGVLKLDGTAVLGSDAINFTVNGKAELFCADGKVALEFEDDGEFAFGFDASAAVAKAEIEGGFSLFNAVIDDKENDENDRSLLGFKAGVGLEAGGEAAFWVERNKAIENDYLTVYTTDVKLSVGLFAEINVDATVPSIDLKWPW